MILQDEFQKNGYKDLLVGNIASESEIDLVDFYDPIQKPKELLSIYISEQGDELFFLLNGDIMEINSLCDKWDDKIRVFTIINKKSEVIEKLKYNIVQLIIYSNEIPDKNRESNLLISRKIIINGNMKNLNHIIISDDEAIELPFHMISPDEFLPSEEKITQLKQLLPTDEKLIKIMIKKNKRVSKRERNGILDKSFAEKNFYEIKEWIER